jgi:hypothetical protein
MKSIGSWPEAVTSAPHLNSVFQALRDEESNDTKLEEAENLDRGSNLTYPSF